MPEIGLREWQRLAAEQQQTFYNQFGDRSWDRIKQTDTSALNTKLSFSLHSTPYEKCTIEQRDSITATREKLLELCGSGDVLFGCVFVSVRPEETREPSIVPLIRTKQTYGDDVYFVEAQPGRVYTGWSDYIENNKLPASNICYPAEGYYRSRFPQRVNIQFKEISGNSKVGIVMDIVSSVAAVASSGLIAATLFFPITAPFVIGAAAVGGSAAAYSATRKVVELVDRGTHHENIAPTDPRALELWVGMGADIIGSILMGGAAVLPRLVASGRLASTMASTVMDVLNWVSVGFNSFGVLANVAVLIGKLRSGHLRLEDITYFISCCLFIGNMVVSPVVAEKVIQSLSNQPCQMGKLFKMVSTTSFTAIKTICMAVTWEGVMETICGDTMVGFLRSCGMKHVAQVLQEIKGALRQFRRGVTNSWTLCMKVTRLLSCHLMKVLDEIEEAWKQTRAFFNSLDLPGGVFGMPSLEAAEIVSNADRVLDDSNINGEARENCRAKIMEASLQMAKSMGAKTEREFVDKSRMAMNDIQSRCDREMVLHASEQNRLHSEDRSAILQAAIEELQNEIREKFNDECGDMEKFSDAIVALQNNHLPLVPWARTDDSDAYIFQIPFRLPEFDQFIYDAACQLLGDDSFMDACRVESGDEPIVMIQCYGNTVLFYYRELKDTGTAVGFAVLKH